tara:strand:- start:2216 stop:2845 length:630 start_codon:yes stop_codon:yes gene_type:complete
MNKISSKDYEKIEKINLDQQKAIKENAKAVVMKEIQEENDKKNYNEIISYFEKNNFKNSPLDSRKITNFIKLHKTLSNRYQSELNYYKGLAEDNKNSMDEYEEEIKDIEKEHKKKLMIQQKSYNKLGHRVLNLREKCKDRNFKIRVLYILLILSNLITFDITYHYQYNTVSYTQYNIQTIIDWSYAFLYLCYLIFSDMFSGIYRAFTSN